MIKTVALVGNPNCGKTTLFNSLTGARQKVGNWSGVTTERKEGEYLKNKSVKLIDLPGLYSLNTKSSDEQVVTDYFKVNKPNAIINVVDGTNLERNLYLTTELFELNIPLVIAITFSDELKKNKMQLNANLLSKILGVPILLVCAFNGENLDLLITSAINNKNKPVPPIDDKSINSRYKFIENTVQRTLVKKTTQTERFTEKADKILLNKVYAFPILIVIVTLVYFLSIRIGSFLGEYLSNFFNGLAISAKEALEIINTPKWITSLLTDAIIKGLGLVLSFAPQILVLFALLGVLEESGYAARATFIIDRLFSSFGLGGRSFIPMILGCGCTVTGLMSTRIIEDEGEKRATIFLTPFMPCGAKTAVFGWFSSIFFNGSAIIATTMYFLGIISVVAGGKILKKLKIISLGEGSFVMEIPLLRAPRIKNILYVVLEKIKDYLGKAGLIVFVVSVFLWALRSLGVTGYVGEEVEKSFLYLIGDKLKIIFYPIGVADWRGSVAVISGIFAKEAVIETLGLLAENPQNLFHNPFSVYAFCAFVLLSPPCAASIVQAYRELKSIKWLAIMTVFQTIFGYAVAFIINLVGNIVDNGLIFSFLIAIIITVSVVIAMIALIKKTPCKNCSVCNGALKCQKKEKRSTI